MNLFKKNRALAIGAVLTVLMLLAGCSSSDGDTTNASTSSADVSTESTTGSTTESANTSQAASAVLGVSESDLEAALPAPPGG